MVFTGEVPLGPAARFAGRRTIRLTFFPLGPDKVRQFSEALNMDGTWSVNYDLIYTRRPGSKRNNSRESARDIDVVLYQSPLLRIGRWRCPATHPCFHDSGPVSETLFVFPRESVMDSARGRGAVCRRRQHGDVLQRRPTLSTFAVERVGRSMRMVCVLTDRSSPSRWPRTSRPRRIGSIGRFASATVPPIPRAICSQRLVFEHVSHEPVPDRLFVEETMLRCADARDRHRLRTTRSDGATSPGIDEARRRSRRSRSRCDCPSLSPALCRSMTSPERRRIGVSPGACVPSSERASRCIATAISFVFEMALEPLRDTKTELSSLALDLGFSSHSHFTETFRRTFGRTPSSLRLENEP